MIVAKDAADQSAYFFLRNAVTGAAWTADPSATCDVVYQRDQLAQGTTACAGLLVAANSAYAANKMFHCGNGLWRVDIPDAAFATGVDHVQLMMVEDTGQFVSSVIECDLSPVVGDSTGVTEILTRLPNATAGEAGGVFIAGTNAATTITTGLTSNLIGDITGAITGNLSGSVGSIADTIDGLTYDVALRTILAQVTGKAVVTGSSPAFVVSYKRVDGATEAIEVTYDAYGNRTVSTIT